MAGSRPPFRSILGRMPDYHMLTSVTMAAPKAAIVTDSGAEALRYG